MTAQLSKNNQTKTAALTSWQGAYGSRYGDQTGFAVNPNTGKIEQYVDRVSQAGSTTTGTNTPAQMSRAWIGGSPAGGSGDSGGPSGPVDRVTSAAVADAERIRQARGKAYATGSGASSTLGF